MTPTDHAILVVDDNEVSLYQKSRLLRQAGYTVFEAATGESALRIVREEQPRLVLLDINLPDTNGWEVCRRIKADPATASVLVMHVSATYVDHGHTVKSLEGGADACLSEPSNPSVMLATVRALLRAREAEMALREALEREQTARAAAEESRTLAEAANRTKDEFLATLSHELRSPLGTILTWAHLLRAGELDEERTQRALEAIERNARLQTQLMEDLLDVSRIISGQMRLEIGTVDLASLAQGTIENLTALAETKQLRLEASIDTSLPPIAGDPTRLQQVLWNLLANAIKFTPPGGRVMLVVDAPENEVRIKVSDTGDGITPEFLPHIFERFRQWDSSSTRAQGGLGLGLAIVRHVVEQHGGSIAAHSEGLGRGATFTVRIPRRPPLSSETAVTGAARTGEGGRRLDGVRVLVVDDEPDARDGTTAILELAGAQVQAVSSVSEAEQAWQSFAPDVLVSDIAMPGQDGFTLIRKLRAGIDPNSVVPAVAVTAYARAEDERRILREGYRAYVTKPIEPRLLVDAVAQLARPIPEDTSSPA